MGSQRPRAAWHTAAGTVVAAYLLAAAAVAADHTTAPMPECGHGVLVSTISPV